MRRAEIPLIGFEMSEVLRLRRYTQADKDVSEVDRVVSEADWEYLLAASNRGSLCVAGNGSRVLRDFLGGFYETTTHVRDNGVSCVVCIGEVRGRR